ncbi:uncharacterized protein N7446_000499 [Penicillium canescens]|uniref:uncharacterized protein n=1 Tax=Penicillium canescens TaxID=5083 RepID=UPI0026DF4B39|nr:uncharacterized protein N7446_000499 [Penicillium canescens]KAJ6077563.1 hypothetical protein N7446_000499 [Penicillium canescens]
MTQLKKDIVVAIDFGTTFSGIAWAHTANPEAIHIIQRWPCNIAGDLGGQTADKTPSELAYNYDNRKVLPVWGAQIPKNMPRLQSFKLDLVPEGRKHRKATLLPDHHDPRRMNYPHRVTANRVLIDYLHALQEHIPKVLKDQFGTALDSMSFKYVIAVPAMWPEKAKSQTRTCAEKAGLGRASDIQIISEPEAAAVHVMTQSRSSALEVDDTIVVCDAGGGTVDCITFTILALQPVLRLKESAAGDGKLCGGIFLNNIFEHFLSERLGNCEGWDDDTLGAAMREFEMETKRSFSGDTKQDFSIPVPGLADNESLGIHRTSYKVTGQELMDTLLPVLAETLELVMRQIRLSKNSPKSVFLVGGFGQSPLLFEYLRRFIPSEISIIAPVNGWTALARGACVKALADMSNPAPQIQVESRVARKHYGIITAGEDIQESVPITTSWVRHFLKTQGEVNSLPVQIYELNTLEGEDAPLYFNRISLHLEEIKKHAILETPLDRIFKATIPVKIGAYGKEYYEVEFKIQARYYSAHCEHSLWFGGKDHGSVKIAYV